MKIIIIPNMPVMSGRHYCIAKELMAQGHEVHYFMWSLPYGMKPKELTKHLFTSLFSKTYHHEDIKVHTSRRLPLFWPYINGWIFKVQLRRLYKKLDADFIFTETYTNETEVPADLPFIYDLADDYAAPADIYGSKVYKLGFRLLDVKGVMKRQCQNAFAVTTVSKMLTDYANKYSKSVHKIPNGVESEIIDYTVKTYGHKVNNPHSIVYATGFGQWSRAIETMQAVVDLRSEYPDIELTLIGDGVEAEKMKKFIIDTNSNSYIHFLGYIYDRKKLFKIINQSSIGLNISDKNKWRDASHPMKVMDYSSLGKKVVSTDLSEVRALNLPNIYLITDKHSFKVMLKKALDENKEYFPEVSKEILTSYSWSKLTKRIVNLTHTKPSTPNIIHVSSVYPPKLGGLEKVVHNLANIQHQEGMKIRVITSDQDAKNIDFKDEIPVKRLWSFSLASTTIMPGLLPCLLRIKKNEVVHAHVVQAFMPEIVLLASKLKKYKYIIHIHLDAPPSTAAGILLNPYKKLILKRVLKAAQYVIVFTQDQKNEYIKKYDLDSGQVLIVPNGVDKIFYNSKLKTLHKKPRLLFVGRLNYQKNLQQLLNALDGISEKFSTTLVGVGEQEYELKHLAKELKLRNVVFAGRAEGDKLLEYYKESDIFVLPSEREGMPLVLLEAMAMGLPIVATNVTGNKDVVIDGRNGVLVPYQDKTALKDALLKLASSPDLYNQMAYSSRSLAKDYSWQKVNIRLKKIYGELNA